MLFPYTYIQHPMEKMHEFIAFIFNEVWCKATEEEYGIHLFEPMPELNMIMIELNRLDLADKLKDGAGKFFYESVNEIFNEFEKLASDDIEQYKSFFDENNMIEELCSGATDINPVTYEQLNPDENALDDKIRQFFKKLYSSGFFDLKFVKDSVGSSIGEYYRAFVRENNDGTCPFCGLLPLDGEYDPTREAFDHYLPKGKYPFNSVNLKNLAPSCYKCNSGNKLDQDPIHDKSDNRRKAFYPFSQTQSDITITITVNDRNWSPPTPEKFSVNIQSINFQEETITWNELFRIEQRYASKCCKKDGGLNWLNRVLNEHQNYNLTRQQMLAAELQSANSSPWVDANFLKKAFLEGCDQAELLAGID